MATYVPVDGPDGFEGGFFFQWAERPPDFPPQLLLPVTVYDEGICIYDYGDQMVLIDVAGPKISMSACHANFIVGMFSDGDRLLLGVNKASQMPIHLLFDPPVRALGTQIAAIGEDGAAYLATLNVRDQASGSWFGRSVEGPVQGTLDTAPFVGLRTKGGLIDEAWFDVISTSGADQFSEVAINHLYYLPR